VPVLIDGNNLLYAARKRGDDTLLIGRSMLCDTLGRWASKTGTRVRVVFDGPMPTAARAAQIGNAAIEVSYSGPVTADAVVVQIIETDSAARRLLVVSTDREIIRAAKRRRAQPMRSEDFWPRVQADLARPDPTPDEPQEKEVGLSPDETERWLREFGLDEPPA
jgi:predicted RNA-binding protein with PIN domain